ncbi:MAG TPA: peptidyl-prolyl cis-trans isomerase [Armatimonadota bacterium]|jgi:parvulin-like peptidyl-prolyl isomerase
MKRIQLWCVLCSGILIGFLSGAMVTNAYSDAIKFNFDQVVGQLGETKITRGDLAQAAITKDAGRQPLGLDLLSGELQEQVLVNEAARLANVTVTADEVDQRIQETFTFAQSAMTRKRLEAVPRQNLEKQLRLVLLVEKMTGLAVTPEEARQFYAKHPDVFSAPPMAKLICIDTLNIDTATKAYNRLKNGEDTSADASTLSKMYSTCEVLNHHKGVAEWASPSSMSPQVAATVFGNEENPALKPGDYSKVISLKIPDSIDPAKSRTGYLIIYVDDIHPAHTPKFDEVRTAATYFCRAAKFSDVAKLWFAKQAQTIGQNWQQITDLRDPLAPLKTMPISAQRYQTAPEPMQ